MKPGLVFVLPTGKQPADRDDRVMNFSIEDDFLNRLARGLAVEQEEYDQLSHDLPMQDLALAFSMRYGYTHEIQALVESARLYSQAGYLYEALEVCSRSPRSSELRRIAQKMILRVQKEYPGIQRIGKLLDEAFLVIDLTSSEIVRFPPILPATMSSNQ
jgi:hypothetical protein